MKVKHTRLEHNKQTHREKIKAKVQEAHRDTVISHTKKP